MSLHHDRAYSDLTPEELDRLHDFEDADTARDRAQDHTPAVREERVRRRYAEQEHTARAACRPLASGVHVTPLHSPVEEPAA